MREIFKQYLDRLIELRIYPFSSLEINFIINFVWVILKSLFKVNYDYRYAKRASTFLEFKLITFILSFLVMFSIVVSLDFWRIYLDLELKYILWWLPSVLAIILAEISGLLAKTAKKEDEGTKEVIYFFISFFVLMVFWVFMVFKVL